MLFPNDLHSCSFFDILNPFYFRCFKRKMLNRIVGKFRINIKRWILLLFPATMVSLITLY